MKQITSNTILKQKDKTYQAIQTEQGIVWFDKDAEIISTNHVFDKFTGVKYVKNKAQANYYKGYPWIGDKIIAANFDLEGVPKIELEDEVKQLARDEYPYIGLLLTEKLSDEDVPFVPRKQREAFVEGYKANQAKYTEEDMKSFHVWAFYKVKMEESDKTSSEMLKEWDLLNEIKEITVDENFKQI